MTCRPERLGQRPRERSSLLQTIPEMEDIAAVKEELAEKRQALEALQRNFDDFQESSRELEDELEAELGRVSAAAVAVCRRYTRCFGVSPPRNDVRVQPARPSLPVSWNRPDVLAVLCTGVSVVRPARNRSTLLLLLANCNHPKYRRLVSCALALFRLFALFDSFAATSKFVSHQ